MKEKIADGVGSWRCALYAGVDDGKRDAHMCSRGKLGHMVWSCNPSYFPGLAL